MISRERDTGETALKTIKLIEYLHPLARVPEGKSSAEVVAPSVPLGQAQVEVHVHKNEYKPRSDAKVKISSA